MTKSAKLYVSELQSQGPKGLHKLCERFKSTEQKSLSSFSSSVVWWLVVAGWIHIDTYISNGAVGEVPKHTQCAWYSLLLRTYLVSGPSMV